MSRKVYLVESNGVKKVYHSMIAFVKTVKECKESLDDDVFVASTFMVFEVSDSGTLQDALHEILYKERDSKIEELLDS